MKRQGDALSSEEPSPAMTKNVDGEVEVLMLLRVDSVDLDSHDVSEVSWSFGSSHRTFTYAIVYTIPTGTKSLGLTTHFFIF